MDQMKDVDELESREEDGFERQRSRVPTIVTSNEQTQNISSNFTDLLLNNQKKTNSKLRDTFARESSFDAGSASHLEAEDCYQSFVRKQGNDHY